MENSANIDVDQYVEKVACFLDTNIKSYDREGTKSDIKEYIYTEADKISKTNSIEITDAVNYFVSDLGSPEQFGNRFLKELSAEKKYLYLKTFIAVFIAVAPFFLFVLALIFL